MDKIDGLIAVELWNVGKFFWQHCTDWAPLMYHNSWVWRARCWADWAFYHHVFQLAGNCEPQLFCACVSSLFKLVCGWSTAFTLTYTYSGFEKT